MTRQRFLRSRLGSPPSWMGTSSASSPTLSGPRTGPATTTSPKRRWPRWPSNRTGYPSWIVVGAGTGGTAAAYAQPGSLRSSFNRHQRLRCPALACETHADQTAGTIVTLMCDSGARYTTTYDDDIWLKEQGIDISPYLPVVERAWEDKVCDGAYSVRRRVSALCFCTVLARSQPAGGRLMRARSPRRRRRWYSAKSASIMIDTDVHLDEYANPAGRKPAGMGRQARVHRHHLISTVDDHQQRRQLCAALYATNGCTDYHFSLSSVAGRAGHRLAAAVMNCWPPEGARRYSTSPAAQTSASPGQGRGTCADRSPLVWCRLPRQPSRFAVRHQ